MRLISAVSGVQFPASPPPHNPVSSDTVRKGLRNQAFFFFYCPTSSSDARALIEKGIDPGDTKKAQKAAETQETETFEVVAREWHTKFSPSWAVSHSGKIIRQLELYVFPWLGNRPIKSITAPELLTVLRRIEAKGILETAHRTQQNCGQVFRYAVATGRAERDPSGDLRGAIPPAAGKHMATITDPKEIAGLLRSIDDYRGSIVTRCALHWRHWFLSGPGSFGMRNGPRSILIPPNGAYRRRR